MKKEVKILFNQEIVDLYKEYYFKKFPKRKKFDFSPVCISLNKFTSIVRLVQASEKVKYGEFCDWVLNYYNVPKLQLNDCKLTVRFIWHNQVRRDYDNYCICLKFYLDSMTKYGLLEDDSFKQIKGVDLRMEYIKGKSPSVEFIFEYDGIN